MKVQPPFLPVSRDEGKRLGIREFDVVIVSGDAYVDHPSFAAALLGRVLWDRGYTVGIIPQPDWKKPDDLRNLGRPRLFFAVSGGAVDSMVNHYTPAKKRRSSDDYSPGGTPRRPDRATIVYTDRLHAIFPATPVIIGGIEASLRRFAHYDYWSDRVRQSILADAPADLLVFGMGETALLAVADRLSAGESIGTITDVAGTAFRTGIHDPLPGSPGNLVRLPSFQEVSADKPAFARACRIIASEQDPFSGTRLVQQHPKANIVQNPPSRPLAEGELDAIYELPFSRRAHPSYREPVRALEPVRFSVVSHRGCYGGCAFCALSLHQGCIIQSRSIGSVVREVTGMTSHKDWKGIVQDVGGPTANMYGASCPRWERGTPCTERSCGPDCPGLRSVSEHYRDLLMAIRDVPGVRKVFVSSGLRYDLFGDDPEFLGELCTFHISGHVKVAPEHVARSVTSLMRKPGREAFENFRKTFERVRGGGAGKIYLLPYFMSGHPGCTLKDMVELAEYIRDTGLYTEQVQDFTPTPMTVSTCMYYTGLDPETMEPVHVPKGREKVLQRALLHYRDERNHELVREALTRAGRRDLIGPGKNCLVPDKKGLRKKSP